MPVDADICPACGNPYGPHELCDRCRTGDLVLENAARILWRRAPRKTFTLRVVCRVLDNTAAKIRQDAETARWERDKLREPR